MNILRLKEKIKIITFLGTFYRPYFYKFLAVITTKKKKVYIYKNNIKKEDDDNDLKKEEKCYK